MGSCDWPFVASDRWTIIGLALLLAAAFTCIYVRDDFRSEIWDFIAALLVFIGIATTWMALCSPATGYGLLLTSDIVALWLAWVIRRIAIPSA